MLLLCASHTQLHHTRDVRNDQVKRRWGGWSLNNRGKKRNYIEVPKSKSQGPNLLVYTSSKFIFRNAACQVDYVGTKTV